MLHSYKTYNFKIFPFLLHGYHTPQLKNIAFPAIAFLSHNFKILPTCQAIWGRYPYPDGEKVSLVFLLLLYI